MNLYTMIDGHWVSTTLNDYFNYILSGNKRITIDVQETKKFNQWLSDREQNKQHNNRR
jgi:hypothetical protein